MNLTNISLFSGVGGMDLGAEAAGIETRAQVEINPFVETSSLLDSPMLYNSATSGKLRGGICSKPAEVAPQSYPAVSPVSPSASPESGSAAKMNVGCGQSTLDSFGNASPLGLLLRMLPLSPAFQSSGKYTKTLNPKITKLGFCIYALRTSAHRTKENDVSLLPTPTANLCKNQSVAPSRIKKTQHFRRLELEAALIDSGGQLSPSLIGKTIHPLFVEWMMGFPEEWTNPDCKLSVMQFVRGRYSPSMNVSQELKEI